MVTTVWVTLHYEVFDLKLFVVAAADGDDLADRYLSWLDGQEDPASGSMLSNLAWTAGVGRSHFPHRAGLVFGSAGQLRQSLRALAGTDESPDRPLPDKAARVAFAFPGQASHRVGMGEALYRSEPVARAVLDRCDEAVREDRGVSLLDVMFGHPRVEENPNDPLWAQMAVYALECSLTAQWASVCIRPRAVMGCGPGGVGAAQAAGVVGLEEGLRLAAALSARQKTHPGPDSKSELRGMQEALADITLSEPSVSLVSSANGGVVGSSGELRVDYWRRQARGTGRVHGRSSTLAVLGVDVIVEIGPDPMLGRSICEAWPEATAVLAVLSTLVAPSGDGETPSSGDGFVRAVASAYEAGLEVSFAGLFAGEVRSRVPVPSYPFQRRRHWI